MTDPAPQPIPAQLTPDTMPPGDYAIVELLGMRTLVGRAAEIEVFGGRMLRLEPLYRGYLLPHVLIGGSGIFMFNWCDAATALDRQAKSDFDLPDSIIATAPAHALRSPDWMPASLPDDRIDAARRAGL